MAGKSGGILGLVIGLLLVGGIVASPFYLSSLRSEPRALDAAIVDDVESIRRAVLGLDESLAALSDLYETQGDPSVLDPDKAGEFGLDHPEMFPESLVKELGLSITAIKQVETRDQARGTIVLGGGQADFRQLEPGKAYRFVKDIKAHLDQHEQLLGRADRALANLRTASIGASSASNHLGVSRIRAILEAARGRLWANKARIEAHHARLWEDAALSQLDGVEELRARLASVQASSPAERVAALTAQATGFKGALAQISAAQNQLGRVIRSKEAQLKQLEDASAEAGAAMAALAAGGLASDADRSRYAELSANLREADASAEALRRGTLKGGNRIPDPGPDPAPPSYEGGTPEAGIIVYQSRFEGLDSQRVAIEAIVARLTESQAKLQKLSEELDANAKEISGQIESRQGEVRRRLAEWEAHAKAAQDAETEAAKALKIALDSAKTAITAARRRTQDAGQAARASDGAVDERLQRVSQDFDMEASMHSLAAEIALEQGALGLLRLEGARARERVRSKFADAKPEFADAGSTEDVQAIQVEAVNSLADASKSYEQAATLIGRTNVRLPSGTISGKNYLWQVQVGQAAVHLLHAALVADDAEASFALKTQAYDLLKEAAQKREQSPLLATSLDTLEYLQHQAR